ncbi:MAG: flagellar hook-associated protein FlgK [Methylobacter sp.]|jgi:flagellar hook-associated protein 1 FlgK
MGFLTTSLTGLMAAQRALETASHNVANVNTEGYSRQRAEQSARRPELTGNGYVGQGVNVNTVTRSYDQFVTNQLNSSTSLLSEAESYTIKASQVDNIVSNTVTGLPPALKAFFNAVNEVANNPTAVSVRQVMISEADGLAKQFNLMTDQLNVFRTQNNGQMGAMVTDINAYAQSIADINVKIVTDASRGNGGQPPNDLLDQRDLLLAQISEKVNTASVIMADGSMSVFIGDGQSLVLGTQTAKLSLLDSTTDSSHKLVAINGQDITSSITGGALRGAIRFRDEVLDPAQNQLGLVAAGFAVEFNKLHKTGFDLNGVAGIDMFKFAGSSTAVPVVPFPGGTGTITAAYDPAATGNLQPSDYRLDFNAGIYSLTRLSDNTAIPIGGVLPASVEGMTITQTALPLGVSSFLIRPTYRAGQDIQSVITDPRKIAAAGTGGVPPIPGDNAVALQLAGLEKKNVLFGAKSTLNDAYSQLISKVATLTHSAKVGRDAQQVLFNQAKQTRENMAGVNLDEEAANLIKFQNAYQASAQAISAAKSMFDVLISAVR